MESVGYLRPCVSAGGVKSSSSASATQHTYTTRWPPQSRTVTRRTRLSRFSSHYLKLHEQTSTFGFTITVQISRFSLPHLLLMHHLRYLWVRWCMLCQMYEHKLNCNYQRINLTRTQRVTPSQPLSTPLFTHSATLDFTTRISKVLARRTGKPIYVSSSMSFVNAGMGGTVEEEMEGFKRVVEVVMKLLNKENNTPK